ncbi:hypothetical protein [Pseudaminobacter soli (ex Li et al. 2025)]|uniref:Uncharacterized protein n=1 Tax=Pseudaminobacter soli (ex Li et al. 2025) TaxID=1295366 RepID=A0A2P7RZY4_9HYPH|nr:hypothetical protein [Mesorhizobium soli]PSJ55754.1 hypothetical protein C7I85_26040 [Mesorhizobium soli]
MIPALSAQMMNGLGGGDPGWIPEGAVAHLNFIGGNYFAGGQSRTVDTILGGAFLPVSIDPSMGMYVDNTSPNRPNAIGPLFDDIAAGLAAGCTVVFEIQFQDDPYGSFIHLMDAAGANAATEWVSGTIFGGAAYVQDQEDIELSAGAGSLTTAGLHKIAFTFARRADGDFEYAVSSDGSVAETMTVDYAPLSPVNTITLFHDGDDTSILDDAWVHSITLYPAVAPAGLPALTA